MSDIIKDEDINIWVNGEYHWDDDSVVVIIETFHKKQFKKDKGIQIKNEILKNQESIKNIREYIKLMENEPDGYIKISEVYHHLKRMIGDE